MGITGGDSVGATRASQTSTGFTRATLRQRIRRNRST
jgi:hypothetical protein